MGWKKDGDWRHAVRERGDAGKEYEGVGWDMEGRETGWEGLDGMGWGLVG